MKDGEGRKMLKIENESETDNNAKIVVVGIGQCGINAQNRMIGENVKGVEFIQMDTHINSFWAWKASVKLQIGVKLTEGLSAGAKPEIGERAAEEQAEKIEQALKDADMVVIVCGMGGGTGTGAAPVVAKIAKKMGTFTVGVVTKPFGFEGRTRMETALSGIKCLKECVDTLIVISNQKLLECLPSALQIPELFRKSDEVIQKGVQGITDLMNPPTLIELCFEDVKFMMKDKGLAHIGIGRAKGEGKGVEAARLAVESQLLEDAISRASDVFVNISGDITLSESSQVGEYVYKAAGGDVNLIWGAKYDENMKGEAIVTVIAMGLEEA